jgi:hypothetical protein
VRDGVGIDKTETSLSAGEREEENEVVVDD